MGIELEVRLLSRHSKLLPLIMGAFSKFSLGLFLIFPLWVGSLDPTKFRDDLFNIARTTLSSKVLSQDKDYFANLAVDAVLRLQASYSAAPGNPLCSSLHYRVPQIWSTYKSSRKLGGS